MSDKAGYQHGYSASAESARLKRLSYTSASREVARGMIITLMMISSVITTRTDRSMIRHGQMQMAVAVQFLILKRY